MLLFSSFISAIIAATVINGDFKNDFIETKLIPGTRDVRIVSQIETTAQVKRQSYMIAIPEAAAKNLAYMTVRYEKKTTKPVLYSTERLACANLVAINSTRQTSDRLRLGRKSSYL